MSFGSGFASTPFGAEAVLRQATQVAVTSEGPATFSGGSLITLAVPTTSFPDGRLQALVGGTGIVGHALLDTGVGAGSLAAIRSEPSYAWDIEVALNPSMVSTGADPCSASLSLSDGYAQVALTFTATADGGQLTAVVASQLAWAGDVALEELLTFRLRLQAGLVWAWVNDTAVVIERP